VKVVPLSMTLLTATAALVFLDDFLGHGEAEAGTLGAVAGGDAVEALEEALQVFFGDADAGVGDADLQVFRLGAGGGDGDTAVLPIILRRIADQIQQHLL
jgi:hypothetical protein